MVISYRVASIEEKFTAFVEDADACSRRSAEMENWDFVQIASDCSNGEH